MAITAASLAPTTVSSSGGTTVTITGTGFAGTTTAVLFGGVPGTSFNVASGTSITVVAPAHSTGSGVPVTVVDSTGNVLVPNGILIADWRSWTDQSGGTLPGATPVFPQVFPGVNPIPDTISGASSIPTYLNVPVTINAVDPFGGWNAQQEAGVGHVMRPQIPGLTSP
jgi:hypothetical protein